MSNCDKLDDFLKEDDPFHTKCKKFWNGFEVVCKYGDPDDVKSTHVDSDDEMEDVDDEKQSYTNLPTPNIIGTMIHNLRQTNQPD